ncbi:MAG: hypothetical protein ACFHWZ_08115 [Phycisphaerales bacterium]
MTGLLVERFRPLALLLGLALSALLLGGCSGTQAHSYSLTMPEGLVRLAVDVENYRGHVEVIADENARSVTVDGWIWLGAEAIKAGGEEPYTLTSVEARIERSPDAPNSGVLRVRTSSEHSEFHDHHVRLVIRAPRVDGLRIVNRGGYVEVVEARGAVEIENASGGIQFRSSSPMVDPVQVLATDTNIWYQVPAGSTGEVVLETLEGRAVYKNTLTDSDQTYTTMSQDGADGSVIRTVLANGTNPVNIRTNRGDIRLLVMEDPVGYKTNFDWVMPELRNYWRHGGSKNYTRNRPDNDYESGSFRNRSD